MSSRWKTCILTGNAAATDSSGVQIQLLADHPHLIPQVGEIRWKEWGHAPEPEQLEWWVDVTGREAGRETLPITWVAINHDSLAVGAVGMGKFDIEERRDRSPWVLGMIVVPQYRGTGIGRKLMQALELWAGQQGYSQLWVATGEAARFYQKSGWTLTERFTRASGEVLSILTKILAT
jgi:GNAT superfamily N-acetyltransferase